MLSVDEAIQQLRRDPVYAGLMRDAYLEADTAACAERFRQSAEFAETCHLLGRAHCQGTILDLGAGTGLATYAFARSGAKQVYALEPDPSEVVGQGAIRRITSELTNVEVLDAPGEDLPLSAASVEVVYARQVLHHIYDLPRVLRESARVLKPGGKFLACREHIVDDADQLQEFLRQHPVHQLAGGEHAHPLSTYTGAIQISGLSLVRVFQVWDTVINAFPAVRSPEELEHYPQALLRRKFGVVGDWVGGWSWVRWLVWRRLNRPAPGRLFSFLAVKP